MGNLTARSAWCLYLSHFLSMWTSRTYEYATIFFIQHAFPGNLLPSSINGIAETVCVLVSSVALGRWVDRSPTRLRPLLSSIIVNRSAIVICCIIWLLTFSTSRLGIQQALFLIILLIGMIEKASRMSNILSMERDWIPTIASYPDPMDQLAETPYDLTHLNTIIRRIDIGCKFLSPLAISGILTLVEQSTTVGFIAAFGVVSCAVEIWSALYVWNSSSELRKAKPNQTKPTVPHQTGLNTTTNLFRALRHLCQLFWTQIYGFEYYFSSDVWIPSLGVAVMHASVLTWSGTLITWLLNYNFSYGQITVAKGIGSLFEISSTFVYPLAISYLKRHNKTSVSGGTYHMLETNTDAEQHEEYDSQDPRLSDRFPSQVQDDGQNASSLAYIVITAKYSIICLLLSVIPTLIALFYLNRVLNNYSTSQTLSSFIPSKTSDDAVWISPKSVVLFLAFLSISFVGRWVYDLAITQLTQVAIPAQRRSEFGGTEMAVVSCVSLVHWVAATVWHQQADFKWLATASVGGISVATVSYLMWAMRWSAR